MRSYREEISIETDRPEEIINLTPQLRSHLRESGIEDGFMLVFPQHTSSAVYINDSDQQLTEDARDLLARLIPETPAGDKEQYNHVDHKENAPAHLKSILLDHNVTLPITDGEFDFGAYQTVYYAEFDGCRPKEILVKIVGE